MNQLPRATVERIFAEEAASARLTLTAVLEGKARPGKRARNRALNRIYNETGCSHRQLAKVVGLAPMTVNRILRGPIGPYNVHTYRRLLWAHGQDRARAIVAGRDFATQADVAAWDALGCTSYPQAVNDQKT